MHSRFLHIPPTKYRKTNAGSLLIEAACTRQSWFLFPISSSTNLCKSVISWRSDLLVEETGVPGENHPHDKLYHMLLYRVHLAWTDLIWFDFWCFNATFNNISAISWQPVLVVEEAGVLWENHRPLVNYHLRLRVECTHFCNLQSRARTHAVLVIGLYDMLDPAT